MHGLLDSWFRQSKIASFQRQLNIYGFQRLTTGRSNVLHCVSFRNGQNVPSNLPLPFAFVVVQALTRMVRTLRWGFKCFP